MKRIFFGIPLFFVWSLFFCGIYRHDVDKQKYIDLAHEPQFDCVGQVFYNNKFYGSCVLLDHKHILSAAHVFIQNKVPDIIPAHYYFLFNNKRYNATSISIHPSYKPGSNSECDLTIMELTEEVLEVIPAKINTEYNELHADIVAVGWGSSRPAFPVDANIVNSEKLAGENVIDSIDGVLINGLPSKLVYDFDAPGFNNTNVMGSAMPKPLEYIGSGGDSGGGMFRYINNEWQLIGICSGGIASASINTGWYGSKMAYTRVSVFADWIKLQMNKE